MSGKVGLALINWKAEDYTIACLRSVFAGTHTPEYVVLLDNESSEGSLERVEEEFPSVEIDRSEKNIGFAAGTNRCVEHLKQEGVDYFWILNNDTEVLPNCLEVLLSSFRSGKKVAAGTGKILMGDNRDTIWYGGASIDRGNGMPNHIGSGERDKGRYNEAYQVPFISGCCMLVSASAWEEVGPLDEDYFAYFEDADWCTRAIKKEWMLRYEPKAVLWHKVNASCENNIQKRATERMSPFTAYLSIRNRIFYTRAHASSPGAVGKSVWSGLFYAALFLLRGRLSKARSAAVGVRDGLGHRTTGLEEFVR